MHADTTVAATLTAVLEEQAVTHVNACNADAKEVCQLETSFEQEEVSVLRSFRTGIASTQVSNWYCQWL
jgi:hypothetical protein